ncbi:MAG TPA: hypothetical protein VLA43_19600 [Longimicrobiales bacterium]|nr:hypothetical protein [Longimicrobiales bacterium]
MLTGARPLRVARPLVRRGRMRRWVAAGDMDPQAVQDLLARPGLWGLLSWKAFLAGNRMARLRWLSAQADTIALLLTQSGADPDSP